MYCGNQVADGMLPMRGALGEIRDANLSLVPWKWRSALQAAAQNRKPSEHPIAPEIVANYRVGVVVARAEAHRRLASISIHRDYRDYREL